MPVHPAGDLRQSFGSVVHGVGGGHVGEQHLGGADVGGGLLTTDVLLAGLQGEAQGGPAFGVHRHPYQATGQGATNPIVHGHEAGVGAAVAHRDPESLGGPDHHVGPPFAGRGQQREGQEVGGDAHDLVASCASPTRSERSRTAPEDPG